MSYETATYKIEKKLPQQIEIRNYEHILLAQISLTNKSRNNAFRNLFKYISGANEQQQKLP